MNGASSLLFVSVQNPDRAADAALRKTVRSWVTKGQHARRRVRRCKEKENCLRRKAEEQEDDDEEPHVLPPPRPDSTSSSEDSRSPLPRRKPTAPSSTALSEVWTFMSFDPADQKALATTRQVKAHVARRQHQSRREYPRPRPVQIKEEPDVEIEEETVQFYLPFLPADQDSAPPFTPSFTSPLLSLQLEDPADMLSVYARQMETSGWSMWEKYRWQELEHGRLFRSQYGQFTSSWAPRCLHPLILSNPAMLATTALFTGCLMRYERGQTIMSPALLRIRSLAYSFVQEAIESVVEQLTDTTLLAVIKLALFEAVFGHREACRVHMEGVAQMVNLRNGLANLGMDGYTAHLLVWFDANLSTAAGTPRVLAEEAWLAAMKDSDSAGQAFRLGVPPSTWVGGD